MHYKELLAGIGIGAVLVYVGFHVIPKSLPKSRTTLNIPPKSAEELLDVDGQEISSPDGSKRIVVYTLDAQGLQKILSVVDSEGAKRYIYIGYSIGHPRWLGNDHVLFTLHCGTSCQGLALVSTEGEVRHGLMSYMLPLGAPDAGRSAYTHFRDWFGNEFTFDGLPSEIASETDGSTTYLIVVTEDEKGNYIGKKRFLLNEHTLKEI